MKGSMLTRKMNNSRDQPAQNERGNSKYTIDHELLATSDTSFRPILLSLLPQNLHDSRLRQWVLPYLLLWLLLCQAGLFHSNLYKWPFTY